MQLFSMKFENNSNAIYSFKKPKEEVENLSEQ